MNILKWVQGPINYIWSEWNLNLVFVCYISLASLLSLLLWHRIRYNPYETQMSTWYTSLDRLNVSKYSFTQIYSFADLMYRLMQSINFVMDLISRRKSLEKYKLTKIKLYESLGNIKSKKNHENMLRWRLWRCNWLHTMWCRVFLSWIWPHAGILINIIPIILNLYF